MQSWFKYRFFCSWIGVHRFVPYPYHSFTVTLPAFTDCYHVPNRSSTGKSRGYAGSPPWHTVAKPGVTVSPLWTQLIPVYYGFTRWSYSGDTNHAGKATVMPRNKPALFRTKVRHGCFKNNWNHRGQFPVITGSTRFIPIQYGACRRHYGVVSVGPGVHTVATPSWKQGQCERGFICNDWIKLLLLFNGHSFLSLVHWNYGNWILKQNPKK